jgi:hypothetical protein
LTRLAKHYGLIGDDQHRQDEVFVIGGSEDYRPTIDGWKPDQDAQREP